MAEDHNMSYTEKYHKALAEVKELIPGIKYFNSLVAKALVEQMANSDDGPITLDYAKSLVSRVKHGYKINWQVLGIMQEVVKSNARVAERKSLVNSENI